MAMLVITSTGTHGISIIAPWPGRRCEGCQPRHLGAEVARNHGDPVSANYVNVYIYIYMGIYIYGYVWKWGIPPIIAIKSRDNDQQNHWV